MKSLMKLTSLLLVETLSNSDYIMVYAASTNCTDKIVSATSSQRWSIEKCIETKLNVISVDISYVSGVCQEFNRYVTNYT